jgi:hypothetical protein
MDMQTLQALLGWSTLVNWGILLLWTLFIVFAPKFVFSLHSRFFKLTQSQFDTVHYSAMAGYKLLIIVFNLVPWFVLRFIL